MTNTTDNYEDVAREGEREATKVGLYGTCYVFSTIVVVPRLGAAFALIVGGQTIASSAIDRFGSFGLKKTPASSARLAGAALLVTGVALFRR